MRDDFVRYYHVAFRYAPTNQFYDGIYVSKPLKGASCPARFDIFAALSDFLLETTGYDGIRMAEIALLSFSEVDLPSAHILLGPMNSTKMLEEGVFIQAPLFNIVRKLDANYLESRDTKNK